MLAVAAQGFADRASDGGGTDSTGMEGACSETEK